MNQWLHNRLGDEYESVLADFIALVISALLVASVWIVYDTVSADTVQKQEICRNEWGHRIDCSPG